MTAVAFVLIVALGRAFASETRHWPSTRLKPARWRLEGGKPARGVRVGDALRVQRMEEVFELDVLMLSVVRGPAAIAQTLYRESEASRVRRVNSPAPSAPRACRHPPETKPDKRARRLIRALGISTRCRLR